MWSFSNHCLTLLGSLKGRRSEFSIPETGLHDRHVALSMMGAERLPLLVLFLFGQRKSHDLQGFPDTSVHGFQQCDQIAIE